MSANRKPVIVRRWTRDWCAGYADSEFSPENPELELLDSSGKLVRLAWESIKWVCYVRELNLKAGSAVERDNPEHLLRRRFSGRPRVAGLWLRLTLGDGEELEGVAANDRTLLAGVGLHLTPPDTRSNTQRIFVPRGSIREMTVMGVVAPIIPHDGRRGGLERAQPELFGSDAEGNGP